jgi:DNA-binding NtrC family response regulator
MVVEHREQSNMTGRILLVEADVALGAVLAEVLWQRGYEVIVVKTLQDEKVDHMDSMTTVILDIDTISVDHEVSWLKACHPYYDSLPIVLMGLQEPKELRERLRFQLGRRQSTALPLVQKPFRNEELLAVVRQAEENSEPNLETVVRSKTRDSSPREGKNHEM